MPDVLPITEVHTADEFVDCILEEGGALLRDSIDISFFERVAMAAQLSLNKTLTPADQPPEHVEDMAERVAVLISQVRILAEIEKALRLRGRPGLNGLVVLEDTPPEGTLEPHADNTHVVEGITVLLPTKHIGKIALHNGEYFDIGEFRIVPGDFRKSSPDWQLRRIIERIIPTDNLFFDPSIERSSEYGCGDILGLLQDNPDLGLAAKVHSVLTKLKPGDVGSRKVYTLEHVIPFSGQPGNHSSYL